MPESNIASRVLTIGSRGSQLALWQARFVGAQLDRQGIAARIEVIKTTGDHLQTASLVQAGGKGLFTKEIEDALVAGDIDLAVHSLKDLPTRVPDGLAIAAIPQREDARDAMVGGALQGLLAGATVGTSSSRRSAQLRVLRPDLNVQPIRGNVDTRLRKLKEGQFDAILLAAAALHRLGLSHEIAEVLAPEQMCPAPGQGSLAIQTRVDDPVRELCAGLNDESTCQAVTCERTVLAALGGGCQMPIGVFAQPHDETLHVIAVVLSSDGRRCVRGQIAGSHDRPEALGEMLASDLLSRGANKILLESA